MIVKGDLIEMMQMNEFDVVIHGCNCFCTMGAGVALRLATKYPSILKADMTTKPGDITKLGGYSTTNISINNQNVQVFNAYTQYGYGSKRGGVEANFNYIHEALDKIADVIPMGSRIGLPFIGCGLAGGNPKKIIPMISEILYLFDTKVVKYIKK